MEQEEEKRSEGRNSYVYILRCGDGTYYTGWTNDPSRRMQTHNQGRGAKYTRGRLPVELVYQERCADKGEALRRERAIKRLSRSQKERLIQTGRTDRNRG